MDFSQIKQELLQALIQDKSTSELSRKLGYSFDQVKRWIQGSKEFRWDEFCDLCEVLGTPLPETLNAVFTYIITDRDDLYFFLSHFRRKYLRQSLRQLHESLNIHPSVLKRYFRGEVFPNLELVLQMIDMRPNLLGSFILKLVGTRTLSPLHARFQKSHSQIKSETLWPLSAAIEGLLSIAEYKQQKTHSEDWFCERLGVSHETFRVVWKELLKSEKVVKDGQKFKITYQTIHLNGATSYQVCKMAEFWTERAKLRMLSPDHVPVNKAKTPNLVGYRIIPMSNETMKKSNEILLKAYQEIIDMAEADSKDVYDDVRVILLHHFSVSDFPENPLITLQDDSINELEPVGSSL